MAKPNYAFEKRQRDLIKKARKEAKRQRKAGNAEAPQDPGSANAPAMPSPGADGSN